MPKRILIVDDEIAITAVVSYYLKRAGYESETVHDGASALKAIALTQFDLIVLDLMLPDVSGLEIARRLKQKRATAPIPIIMLTAKVEEQDILTGFELRADDYVTKPFSPKVLVARINSVLRQIEARPEIDALKAPCDGLIIFPKRHETYVDNLLVELTPAEFELLLTLVEHPGWAMSREQLLDEIKGKGHVIATRGLDILIMNLRKKLNQCGDCIQTVRGVGYKFAEPSHEKDL